MKWSSERQGTQRWRLGLEREMFHRCQVLRLRFRIMTLLQRAFRTPIQAFWIIARIWISRWASMKNSLRQSSQCRSHRWASPLLCSRVLSWWDSQLMQVAGKAPHSFSSQSLRDRSLQSNFHTHSKNSIGHRQQALSTAQCHRSLLLNSCLLRFSPLCQCPSSSSLALPLSLMSNLPIISKSSAICRTRLQSIKRWFSQCKWEVDRKLPLLTLLSLPPCQASPILWLLQQTGLLSLLQGRRSQELKQSKRLRKRKVLFLAERK